MTLTRAWTLEMTGDWTHTRITEHGQGLRPSKHCRARRRVRAFQLVARAHHLKTLTSEGKCKEEIVHASLEDDVAKKKTLWNVLSTDVIAATRKKRNSPKKHKLTGSSPQTLQLRSSLARPRMALPPQTANIAISSSVAKSQDSSISEVYSSTTLTSRHTAAKGSDHGMR